MPVRAGYQSRPPISLLQSSFLPFPLVDSSGSLVRARSPVASGKIIIGQSNLEKSLKLVPPAVLAYVGLPVEQVAL